MHSALCLVLCFFSSAAIWLLVEAEFLAIVLILVYVGAVMVLFLFVVMMLDVNVEEVKRGFTRYAWLGWLVAFVVIAQIVGVVWFRGLGIDATGGTAPLPADYSNTARAGRGPLHPVRLSVRAGRRAAAGGDHRGDLADDAQAAGPEGPGRGGAGGGAARRTACAS